MTVRYRLNPQQEEVGRAYWSEKTVKGHRYVYVWTRVDGRQKQVKPRSLYSHLDSHLPDKAMHHNIDAWVEGWALQHEDSKVTPDNILFSDSYLSSLIDGYTTYLKVRKKRHYVTVRNAGNFLRKFAVPYFLSKELSSVQTWPTASIRMLDYLQEKGVTTPTIRSINNALRGFWQWLEEESLVTNNLKPGLRNPPTEDEPAVLKFTVTPEEMLSFVRSTTKQDINLIALMGYFFVLRPQETFGMKITDFKAGEGKLECQAANKSAGLFDRLVFNVQRQRMGNGVDSVPKSYSKGWVACFNKEAAEILVGILNSKKKDDRFFTVQNRELYKRWQDSGYPNVTPKDLRRAGLYRLGHNTALTPIQLMKMARHKEFETTQLYLRRPEEEVEAQSGTFNLGA